MLGLIVIAGLIFYFLLLFWITRYIYRRAIACEYSKLKSTLFSGVAFLLIFLPIFWDFFPLLAMKKYYCTKDGGTKTYQTPSQWVKENSDRAKNVWFYKWGRQPETASDGVDVVGNRFGNRFLKADVVEGWVRSYESQFIDIETGKVLVSRKEYVSLRGPRGQSKMINEYKFWLKIDGCEGTDSYWEIVKSFKSLGVEQ